MKIAVMGYGTIGSGVVDVLRINKERSQSVRENRLMSNIFLICGNFRETLWKMPLYMIIRRS